MQGTERSHWVNNYIDLHPQTRLVSTSSFRTSTTTSPPLLSPLFLFLSLPTVIYHDCICTTALTYIPHNPYPYPGSAVHSSFRAAVPVHSTTSRWGNDMSMTYSLRLLNCTLPHDALILYALPGPHPTFRITSLSPSLTSPPK